MKVYKSVLFICIVFILSVCLLRSPSAFGEEWSSPQFTGGAIFGVGNVFTGEKIDGERRRAAEGGEAYIFGGFKLQATVSGRVSGGHTYFSNISIKIIPDRFARVYGESKGISPTDAATRVLIKHVSFPTVYEADDTLGPLHVVSLPPPIIDSTTTPAGSEYTQDLPLGGEICVPGDVVLNIAYEVGVSGIDELVTPYPSGGLELRPFRWQMSVPGPIPQISNPISDSKNAFFGYVYSADEAHTLHGIDVHVKDYGFGDSRYRGYDTTDESGYFEVRFETEAGKERMYKIYIGDDTAPAIVQDYYENHYYDERKRMERIPPGSKVPVVFGLERKKPPGAMITRLEPLSPTEGEEITFAGRGYARREKIVSYRWHSSADGYLSDKSVFSARGLTAGVDHAISFSCTDELGFTSPEDRLTLRINRRPRAYIYNMDPNPASEGDAVNFRLDAFDDDPDGKITKIKCWARRTSDSGAGRIVIYEDEPEIRIDREGQPQLSQATFSQTFLTEGEYEIIVTACDDLGAWASDPNGGIPGSDPQYGPFKGDVKRLVIGSVSIGDYDLVISSIDFLETPRVGEEARTRVIIANLGTDDLLVSDMKLSYHMSGIRPARNIVSLPANFFIAAGGEVSFDDVYWTPEESGDQTLVFEIDFDHDYNSDNGLGIVDEIDEYNVKEVEVDVLEPLFEYDVGEEEGLTEVDLEIIGGSLEFSAPSFIVGQNIKITAKVKNAGAKKLYPVEVAFLVNEDRIGEIEIGALDPGEEKQAIMWWMPEKTGEYRISAIADPRKRFDEGDEENNKDTGSIAVITP